MRNAIKSLNKSAIYISAFVLGFIMLLIVADVFLKNVFFLFIPGVFELTRVFLTIIVFMSIAYVHDNRANLVTDVIYNIVPRTGKWILSIISSLIFLKITCLMTWFILRFAITQISSGDHTSTLHIPLWLISILATIGMLLFSISVICDLVFILKNKEVLTFDTN